MRERERERTRESAREREKARETESAHERERAQESERHIVLPLFPLLVLLFFSSSFIIFSIHSSFSYPLSFLSYTIHSFIVYNIKENNSSCFFLMNFSLLIFPLSILLSVPVLVFFSLTSSPHPSFTSQFLNLQFLSFAVPPRTSPIYSVHQIPTNYPQTDVASLGFVFMMSG